MTEKSSDETKPVDLSRAGVKDIDDDVRQTIEIASTQVVPLEIDRISISQTGAITPANEQEDLSFAFQQDGLRFEANYCRRDQRLTLQAILGVLPYSVESPETRRLLKLGTTLSQRLPRARLSVTEAQQLVARADISPPSPKTSTSFIASALSLAFEIKALVALVEEARRLGGDPSLLYES